MNRLNSAARPHPRKRVTKTRCRVAVAVLTLLAGLLIAVALPPSGTVRTTIDIAAPPSRVWAVLADTAAWPAWNPEISALHGPLVPGARVEIHEGAGDDEMVFHPVLRTVEPGHELSWRGHILMPHLFDVLHAFTLAPTQAGGTRFTQSEQVRGVLLWFYDVEQLRPSSNAMNLALKARAEQS